MDSVRSTNAWVRRSMIRPPLSADSPPKHIIKLRAGMCRNRPFARSGHMVRNKLHWDANYAVGFSKQRKVGLDWYEFLCFESPTASQCNLFRTMRTITVIPIHPTQMNLQMRAQWKEPLILSLDFDK